MTQDELSRISGVDRSMISKMENGLVFPSMKVFLSLCIALKITLDTLFEGWDEIIWKQKHYLGYVLSSVFII